MERGRSPDWCPRCGAAYEPTQEYCLECGERLPTNRGVVGVLAGAWQRRFPWYPGDWIWPALLLFVLTVIATAGAVAAVSTKGPRTVVATTPGLTVGQGDTVSISIATSTLPAAPAPTITTGPLPTAAGTAAPAPRAGGPIAWPAGKSGYTDVLEAIPVSAGLARGEARARAAAAAGLPQAGVLDSAKYSSLHPGYFVVFSGVYATAAQATAALASAHARGFPDAYEARVTR
jgi:hypothetical protein